MKLFHTADWHLGKLIQGIYMTEDQRFILNQFIEEIIKEKPDAVIIAGDLYDRAVPSTEAVELLDDVLKTIVMDLKTPVIAIAGNHDSPGRLNFGSQVMKANGLHIVGQLSKHLEPVVLKDQEGEVYFHLIPYADPSMTRQWFEDETIHSHQEAMEKIITHIQKQMDQSARHVLIGHAFVTPFGEPKENTSDSERPLSIGGAEHVDARLFEAFQYTALGHLHQAHHVGKETIRYSGSPMKYSISEEHHNKGFLIVEIDGNGKTKVEQRSLTSRRDMRTVEAHMEELLTHKPNEDYVFVKLLDEMTVLSPMEKVRSVYPNAMHVERKIIMSQTENASEVRERHKMDELSLFDAFYKEIKGESPSEETLSLFQEVLGELLGDEKVKA